MCGRGDVLVALSLVAISPTSVSSQAPAPLAGGPSLPQGTRSCLSRDRRYQATVTSIGYESRVEIRTAGGKLLWRKSYASTDGEHGMGVDQVAWTPDSRFFVWSMELTGGHSPWHFPLRFFDVRTRRAYDPESRTGPEVIGNFGLKAPDVLLTRIARPRSHYGIRGKAGRELDLNGSPIRVRLSRLVGESAVEEPDQPASPSPTPTPVSRNLGLGAGFRGVPGLWRLSGGRTKMVNALWGENPKERQFGEGRNRVVIANLKGPGMITMIHFALPQTLKIDRDTVLRMYWDGEKYPSVESPLCDFFCDPNGALERVDSLLVNKKRGWNCYFPMPFARSARVEVEYDNPRYPNGSWAQNPCYSYVIFRPLKSLPPDTGYFHACWRQKTAQLLDGNEYEAMNASGPGQFVGWNLTVRGVGKPGDGYPVDENEKFYIDGESEPSIEWQGLEDSFGFSWGFPSEANSFPRTGYQPYYNGAAAYRFCLEDRIVYTKSLRLTIGFGKDELKAWKASSPTEPPLQFSTVCYWYQKEPHTPYSPVPEARFRRPAMLPVASGQPRESDERLSLKCGSPDGDVDYLADGWDFRFLRGYAFSGPPWTSDVKHCWADFKSLQFDLVCPKGVAGTLRLYLLDGDSFMGGRAQSVEVNGSRIGDFSGFQAGRWVEVPISAADTASGEIHVVMRPLKPGNNAVVTFVRFIASQ